MGRDLLFSLALHAGIVLFAVITSPFEIKSQLDNREVISVDVLFDGPPAVVEAAPEEPEPEPVKVSTPKTVEEEPEEIPISDLVTNDEEIPIDEEPEPEPEVEEEPPPPDQSVVQQPPDEPTTSNQTTVDEGPAPARSTLSGEGAVFEGATISNSSFNYPYWFTQTFNKILRNWRNPVASDGVIVCAVYFEVIKSGRIIVKRIETSSGIKPFDDACLAAVDRANPFPPLPRQFGDEIIGITLPFKYDPSR